MAQTIAQQIADLEARLRKLRGEDELAFVFCRPWLGDEPLPADTEGNIVEVTFVRPGDLIPEPQCEDPGFEYV